jgi:hypothetical protein
LLKTNLQHISSKTPSTTTQTKHICTRDKAAGTSSEHVSDCTYLDFGPPRTAGLNVGIDGRSSADDQANHRTTHHENYILLINVLDLEGRRYMEQTGVT